MPPLYKISMGNKEHYVWTNEELKEYFKNQDEKFYNNEENNNMAVSV